MLRQTGSPLDEIGWLSQRGGRVGTDVHPNNQTMTLRRLIDRVIERFSAASRKWDYPNLYDSPVVRYTVDLMCSSDGIMGVHERGSKQSVIFLQPILYQPVVVS